jgi:hypothetical protein
MKPVMTSFITFLSKINRPGADEDHLRSILTVIPLYIITNLLYFKKAQQHFHRSNSCSDREKNQAKKGWLRNKIN